MSTQSKICPVCNLDVDGQKKLIELFGNYWHQKKDERERISHFKKYGFSTLIIWENELSNLSELKAKILSFHQGEEI